MVGVYTMNLEIKQAGSLHVLSMFQAIKASIQAITSKENKKVIKSAETANSFRDFYSAPYNLPDQMHHCVSTQKDHKNKYLADSSLPKLACDEKCST